MKKLLLIFTLPLFLTFCSQQDPVARVVLQSTPNNFIRVNHPVQDYVSWNGHVDTLRADENNQIIFEKSIRKPQYVKVLTKEKSIYMILVPGQQTTIEYIDSTYVFTGENSAGITLLNSFKRPEYTLTESAKYEKDSTAIQISSRISPMRESELKQVTALLNVGKIDKNFADLLLAETNYYYALRILEVISTKGTGEGFDQLAKETIKNNPIATAYKPGIWIQYAQSVLFDIPLTLDIIAGKIQQDSISQLWEKDQFHAFQYQWVNRYENREIAEKVLADYLLSKASRLNFEKSLIGLSEQFDKEFPGSIYSQYINKKIAVIRDFHKKIAREMPETIKIIENDTIKNLKELIEVVKGEKYYVDLWASWCSPCKREFKHNPELNAFLKTKGYKKLYISIDKAKDEDKWINDIKYFELDGLHFLASKEFVVDFEKNHSPYQDLIMIPQYMIINEQGEILEKTAPNPSELPKLKELMANL